MTDFSFYLNAVASDSMQTWAHGRISLTAVMIWSLLRLLVYLSTVFTCSGMKFGGFFIAVDASEMEELGFSSTRFLTVSFDHYGSGRTWKLGRRDGCHKYVDNSIWSRRNCDEAEVLTIWSAGEIPVLKQLEFWILHSWLQSKCFVIVKMSDFF